MPFDEKFRDVYVFGIKGAAQEAGAYAERVDEQIFTEGILERVFNQISRADVIVADMTGRNPNVFYEVGYAHALGKIVLLLTQDADDIPFDLKHHQHAVYGGKIEALRSQLTEKLRWAIAESRRRARPSEAAYLEFWVGERRISHVGSGSDPTTLTRTVAKHEFALPSFLRNVGARSSTQITHVYLSVSMGADLVVCQRVETSGEGGDVLILGALKPMMGPAVVGPPSEQYRLPVKIPDLPAGAIEDLPLYFRFRRGREHAVGTVTLKLHSSERLYEFCFLLDARQEGP